MLIKLSETLKKYAKWWIVLVFFALFMFVYAIILPREGAKSGRIIPIDLMFFYTPAKVYAAIHSYGEAGRANYRSFELTIDIVYPIVYTLFFSLAITWLFQHGISKNSKMQNLNVLPFGAWLFDLLENFSIVSMLSIYPNQPAILAWAATAFTMAKWLFAGAFIALLLIGIAAVSRKIFKRNQEGDKRRPARK